MLLMPDTFSHSHDGERFNGHFASREAALEELRAADVRGTVFTAKNEAAGPYKLHRLGERVIEEIQEAAFEQCGEIGEDYLSTVSVGKIDRLDDALNAVIAQWIETEGLKPKFFHVVDVQQHAL